MRLIVITEDGAGPLHGPKFNTVAEARAFSKDLLHPALVVDGSGRVRSW